MDKIKLAFIGSGGIVRSHLEHGLKDFEDVEFVGWCDLVEETAVARREQVGGRGEVYTDARRMLDEARPDAVYIMLPPSPTERPSSSSSSGVCPSSWRNRWRLICRRR